MEQLKTKLQRKQAGIHFTPPKLARFLAANSWECHRRVNSARGQKSQSNSASQTLRVLDPACGDGRLLAAFMAAFVDTINECSDSSRGCESLNPTSVELVGYETDAQAAETAYANLESCANVSVSIRNEDYLDHALPTEKFDLVISNPPYVRTQTLGQQRARQLAERYGLAGRVDLYHAFVVAMTEELRERGTLGLLTSNRFMYVQSGQTMRQLLESKYQLQQIYDLGDTKLFDAAVLPVVVVGCLKDSFVDPTPCKFSRVHCAEQTTDSSVVDVPDLLEHLGRSSTDRTIVRSNRRKYEIESGHLKTENATKNGWKLSNDRIEEFCAAIQKNCGRTFADVAEIKVGIKTTADAVFVRDDWDELPVEMIPEPALLKPLITHHVAHRWIGDAPEKSVLYPYRDLADRTVVDLKHYPNAARYLAQHRTRLAGRKYLIDGGREWFEIWVPQQPDRWSQPKIVWPDISESPTFFLDETGAIVNGDCYWIKLRDGFDPDWLYLMLAVANSKIALQFYDFQCQNRLYAGRRRFMTQYVKQFPLPSLETAGSREVVRLVKQQVHFNPHDAIDSNRLEELVGKLLGV